jgi:hypothetical protein
MKRAGLLLTGVFLALSVSAQTDMGRIEVNKNNSATLKFDHDISMVVFGNNPQVADMEFKHYDFFYQGDICVIRGNYPESPETSITIYLEDKHVYYGIVKYGDSVKLFYDFRGKEQVKPIEVRDANPEQHVSRVRYVCDLQDEYYSIGARDSGITYQVANMRNDSEYTYIKLKLMNNSGGLFNMDGILFRYIQGKSKGVKAKDAQLIERLSPVHTEGNLKVQPYSTEVIGIVLPLFTITNKGKLEINIRERNGTRNMIIEIPGKTLNKVKVL